MCLDIRNGSITFNYQCNRQTTITRLNACVRFASAHVLLLRYRMYCVTKRTTPSGYINSPQTGVWRFYRDSNSKQLQVNDILIVSPNTTSGCPSSSLCRMKAPQYKVSVTSSQSYFSGILIKRQFGC